MRVSTNTALVVDDDEFFRFALRAILASTLGFSDLSEAESFDEAVTLLSEKKIDLAVFNPIMPKRLMTKKKTHRPVVGGKPLDSTLTIPAEIHNAVMELS
jgi:DNA-binding NarL/FixJ family response regulator